MPSELRKRRSKAAVHVAVATLSYSEREAIEHIMANWMGMKGLSLPPYG